MAALQYKVEHNKVGYLLKPTGSDDYHNIIDFLRSSHIGPQSPDPVAPVLKHDHSSTQPEPAAGSFPFTEDAPLGGDFHTSPLRSSHTPHAGHPSGGAEDPITLTALSYVVSTLVQKVHSLEAELHDYKNIFKDVVGKLVKKVKSLEVKLKAKKRKMVVSDSDEEDGTTPNVDLDALYAPTDVPVATTPADSSVAPGASSVAPGASSVAAGAFSVTVGASSIAHGASGVAPSDSDVSPGAPACASNKGKSPMIEEDILVLARTFRQMEEDRLSEEAARRLHEEEMVEMERERAEAQRKRQQEVLESAKFYNEDDWLNIRAQMEANASLSKTLLGDDVSEDNFPARMAALIKKKRQALAEQLFKERQNRPLTPAQQKTYVRQKSLGRKHMHKPKSTLPTLDLDAPARTFLKVIIDEDSNDEDSVDEVWSAVVGWKILSTLLGDINALYRIDGSTKHFATLRQILYMVDRQDLIKLYGLVVQYYKHHTATGVGLLFWGDLQVLFDSLAGGKGYSVWQNQNLWEIQSWRLYTLSNIHVLETVSDEVLSMIIDVSYPLSVELMKKMLLHKLEIDSVFVGNDLTIAEQLIQLIKAHIVAAHASSI
uniref:Aminoacyl-tRNA synthetase, class 1a, anticodon-binding n=1 Tax=Tanacetum cinerariifolium TaxID=118510 RepID=A0A699J8S2_TANCI|nr:aminoacyl-tRNA synthetase, class 1a, anticodon-binding [Tanacetum cinerariifolium]